jgi:uncharacterized protein YjbI with pentapeptide repeats
LKSISQISFETFTEMLEEVAVTAWHFGGRTTTLSQVEKRIDVEALKLLNADTKSGIHNLMVAFYFHPSRRGDETVEFTHKSFGEYLTGRRLVRQLDDIHEEFDRHQINSRKGWSQGKCLEAWAEIAGPATLNEDLLPYVHNEIALRESRKEWRQTVHTLFHSLLDSGGLHRDALLGNLDSLEDIVQYATNAERSLLSIGCLAFSVDGQHFEIKNPTNGNLRRELRNWFIRLAEPGQHLSIPGIRLQLGEPLDLLDFSEANLERVSFIRTSLVMANLGMANLCDSNLYMANLHSANLVSANLSRAILKKADLGMADLRNANLKNANLKNANLSEANLISANLSGADLLGANLTRSKLVEADLSDTILIEADLSKSDLLRTNLSWALMSFANENLDECNLKDAQNVDKAIFDSPEQREEFLSIWRAQNADDAESVSDNE